MVKAAMKCSSCDSDLPQGAKFCMECGTPVSVEEPSKNATSSNEAPVRPKIRKLRRASRIRKLKRENRPVEDTVIPIDEGELTAVPVKPDSNGASVDNPISSNGSKHPPATRNWASAAQSRGFYSEAFRSQNGGTDDRQHGPFKKTSGSELLAEAEAADLSGMIQKPGAGDTGPAERSPEDSQREVTPEPDRGISDVADASDVSGMIAGTSAEEIDVADAADVSGMIAAPERATSENNAFETAANSAEEVHVVQSQHAGGEDNVEFAVSDGSDRTTEPAESSRPTDDDEGSRIIAAAGLSDFEIDAADEMQPAGLNKDLVPASGGSVQSSPGHSPPARVPEQPMSIGGQDGTNAVVAPNAAQSMVNAPPSTPMVMPVPQFVPVPVADPGLSRPEMQMAPQVTQDSSEAPPVKLPRPEDTGEVPKLASADQSEEAVTEKEVVAETVSSDESQTSRSQLQQKRAAALRRFRELAAAAISDLLARQEPIPQKIPRLLARNISRLEATKADQKEEIIRLIGVLANTRSPGALEALRDYSSRRQPAIRLACAEGFREIDHTGSSVALLKFLDDSSPEVVDASVKGLLALEHPEVYRPLVAFGVADLRVRGIIREFVQEAESDQCSAMVDALNAEMQNEEDADHAALALQYLALIRGKELLKTCGKLTRHKSPELRAAAVEALAKMEENQAVRFLNSAMKDQHAAVRSAAAAGIAKVNSPKSCTLLIAALNDPDITVRRAASKTLSSVEGNEEISAAVSKALNAETDPAVIEYLLEVVGRSGTDDALITLQKYLDSSDVEMRHRAINTLRRLRNKKGARMVAPFLKDDNEETRRLAVEAVGQLGSDKVVPTLRELLAKDRVEAIRAAAARSLGELKDQKAISVLEEALHDGRSVRCQAIIAMGLIGDKSVVPALLAQLRDQAPEIRYHACNALGEIGDLPNPEPLHGLLDDREAMVRRSAEATLTKLGHAYARARWQKKLKKVLSGLVPSTVAGAMPGGVAALVALAVVVIAGASFFVLGSMDFSSEPDFPVSDIRAIAISPDRAQISVARKFRVLEVWDLHTGESTAQFQSEGGADSIIYRKNGNPLFFAGTDSFELNNKTVAEQGKESLKKAGLQNVNTHRVAVTPDAATALTSNPVGSAALIDLETGEQKLRVRFKDFNADSALAISPDATLAFAGADGGRLNVVSLKDGKSVGVLNISKMIGSPGAAVTALAMDRSATLIAVGTGNGHIAVVDINSMEIVGEPYSGKENIQGLAFVGDTKKIHAVTRSREILACSEDFSSSKPLNTKLLETPELWAFSVDGTTAAFGFSESDKFCVVDLEQDKVLIEYPPRK